MTVLEFKRKSNQADKIFSSQGGPPFPPGASPIGIDLGTTNSVVTVFLRGGQKPQTLVYEGKQLVPSMVYYEPLTRKHVVGERAKQKNKENPQLVVKSTKRSMGRAHQPFVSQGHSYMAEEVASHVLSYLMTHHFLVAEKQKYGGIWAVITVPAHFDDAARLATISAAEAVGIYVLRIINEPTAAALAYSMISEDEKDNNESLVVFDLGGGTFDVSVVDKQGLTFHVLSSEGDVNLGGDDVDSIIADFLLTCVRPEFVSRRQSADSELYRRLLVHAEDIKKQLGVGVEAHIEDHNVDGQGATLSVTMLRDDFESRVRGVLERTIYLTESALHAAKRNPKTISRILLVGGSTRLALVRTLLSGYFPCPVDARLEPDLAVSWGASLQAAIILGVEVDTILVDVCSHTLGVGVVDNPSKIQENFKITCKKYGLPYPISESELALRLGVKLKDFQKDLQDLLFVAPILYRNSPLPARKSEFFNTVYNNQQAVHVVVVQGEHDTVGENRLIGSFMFDLEQPCPKGTRCEIQLTYDVNGMVHVFARQLGTHNEARAHFDSRTGEVKGWTPVDKQKSSLGSGTVEGESSSSSSSASERVFPQNLVTLGFAKSLSVVEDGQEDETSSPSSVMNALIMRARRYMSQAGKGSADYAALQQATQHYIQALERVRQGERIDDEVESLEETLLSLLEGK